MKFWQRSGFATVFFVLLASLGVSSSARAATYYYQFYTPPSLTVNCTSSGQTVSFSITGSIGFQWHLPASGATIHGAYLYDGVPDTPYTFTESGDYHGTFGGYGASTQNGYPATFGQQYQTEIGGQIVDSTLYIATCTGDGTGSSQVFNTIDLSGSGGGSAISDGRINPENYAPVALYCDGSVLTAYKIDATGGTLAWSFDLASDSTASPLIDLDGIALSKTGDDRDDVLAQQQDGKEYLFVFDGCPAPGVAEVYVSDPVTGQMVRTD